MRASQGRRTLPPGTPDRILTLSARILARCSHAAETVVRESLGTPRAWRSAGCIGGVTLDLQPPETDPGRFRVWLFHRPDDRAPARRPARRGHSGEKPHPWWKVMCLTGVDYFSTLGYQPGIAVLAAGLLCPARDPRPGAAHPVRRAAGLPAGRRGEPARPGLDRDAGAAAAVLAGQAVRPRAARASPLTDFIITITLSAADASAHMVENPHVPGAPARPARSGSPSVLVALLGAVFLKGFTEAIGVAVGAGRRLPRAQRRGHRGRRRRRSSSDAPRGHRLDHRADRRARQPR